MYDPNDDTDVTSGTTDGALMETTSPPGARYGDHLHRALLYKSKNKNMRSSGF